MMTSLHQFCFTRQSFLAYKNLAMVSATASTVNLNVLLKQRSHIKVAFVDKYLYKKPYAQVT